jgi:hypothetical protein
MKLELSLPLTDEQAKLVAECDRIDIYLGVLGGPIPIGQGAMEPIVDELGRLRVAEVERTERQRLEVVRYALERRLDDLERAK